MFFVCFQKSKLTESDSSSTEETMSSFYVLETSGDTMRQVGFLRVFFLRLNLYAVYFTLSSWYLLYYL